MTPVLPDAVLVLLSLHTVGAALGAGAVTFAELSYFKGIADGKLDTCEKNHIRSTFFALRWGMSLLLISGIGLTIVEYFLPTSTQHVLSPSFWIVNTLTLVILLFGFLLSRKIVPMWLGGSVALTSWWMILILDAWHGASPSYLSLLISFILSSAFVAFGLACIRGLIKAHSVYE